jgi:SAM-dependent methyltransferase
MEADLRASPLETQDWAGEMGERWLKYRDQFEAVLAPVGVALMEVARFKSGDRVIDVGCGAGVTTLAIARRVASKGFALGLDVSMTLIEDAKRRAASPGVVLKDSDVRFQQGDATKAEVPDGPFDVLFSRFGLMFFEDPYRSFEHMRGWLKPRGRLVFCSWAPVEANPWISELNAIVRRHMSNAPEMQPNAPGPFGLADVMRINDILVSAGYADIRVQGWRGDIPVAGQGANSLMATEFAWNALHVGQVLETESEEIKGKVRRDIEALYKDLHDVGGVMMRGAAWLVTARNDG